MLAKAFAVIAAVFLVGSLALGTLAPADLSLADGLAAIDRLQIGTIEVFVRAHLSSWFWDKLVTALLVRPVWLLPAACGLVFAGASMSAASRRKPAPSRRRRL